MQTYQLISNKIVILFCMLLLIVIGCDSDDTVTITDPPPIDTTTVPFLASDFSVAEDCQPCHPQHYDEWSGSMHAYSVKDPSWLAIREVGQGQYVNALDGACSPCHSPIGLIRKKNGNAKDLKGVVTTTKISVPNFFSAFLGVLFLSSRPKFKTI